MLSSITPYPPLSGLANPSICFPVKQAKQIPAVKIVDENWLRAAILGVQAANGSQSSASQLSSAAPPSAPASAATKGKKRAHDEVQSYRDPSADDDALENEEEEQPPLKKPKDGQKAKSTSLVCGFSLSEPLLCLGFETCLWSIFLISRFLTVFVRGVCPCNESLLQV